jgi:hypothetical protein
MTTGAPLVHADAPGDGPERALPLPSGPATVAVGQRIWYAFQYAGDGSPILVDMSATPGGSANFAVYTPGDTATPVGRGAPQTMTRRRADGAVEEVSLYGGDLIWSGNFPSSGVYYVVVDQTGGAPATINLEVTGPGVSAIPGAAATATPQPTSVPATAACVPAAPPEMLQPGGPGSAPAEAVLLPSNKDYLLPVGHRAWYAFQYNGDGSPVLIDVRATPEDSASFAVYTPGDLTTPVGRGSQQTTTRRSADGSFEEVTLYGGDLVWRGNFRAPGAYYVAVEQTGPNPSTVRLGISGSGVSGSQPLSTLPSGAPSAPVCSPAPTPVPTPAPVPAGGPGSSPDTALPLSSDKSYILARGQGVWYAFEYGGGDSPIMIQMSEAPRDSAGFAVYTPGNLATPVGRGSRQTVTRRNADGVLEETDLYGGNLVWTGSFPAPGTYYVLVIQSDPNPSTISFDVSGSGVSAPSTR